METKHFKIKVPKAFPVTAHYSQDWIREQVKLTMPLVKQFEVNEIKVEYISNDKEKIITATCILYQY